MRASLALALLLASAPAGAGSGPPPTPDEEAGGEHWRIEASEGGLHVWRPGDFEPRSAGIVVYVHGYKASLDEAWREHGLARQFAESRKNALFIAAAGPTSDREPVRFKTLDSVLAAVAEVGIALPAGPIVVVGHSGAFRTILGWLGDRRLQHLILLDGLYGRETPFHAWLRSGRSPKQLVVVGAETALKAERLARRYRAAARRDVIPDREGEFTVKERSAPLLFLRSQYEHMQIVLSGRVIPLLLRLMPLTVLEAPRGY